MWTKIEFDFQVVNHSCVCMCQTPFLSRNYLLDIFTVRTFKNNRGWLMWDREKQIYTDAYERKDNFIFQVDYYHCFCCWCRFIIVVVVCDVTAVALLLWLQSWFCYIILQLILFISGIAVSASLVCTNTWLFWYIIQ